MRRAMAIGGLMLGLALVAGCSGEYTLTVPDQIVPSGGQAVSVVRLQRNEFAGYKVAVKEAAIRFQIDKGPIRAAYTDKNGYAAAPVPAQKILGRYYMSVGHLDRNGEEIQVYAPAYVWDALAPVTAVEMDSLPTDKDAKAAADALGRIAANSYIVYFTTKDVAKHAGAHQRLKDLGYPDGAIVLWQEEGWRLVSGPMPKVVVEERLISSLVNLRKAFGQFNTGVCTSEKAARAFAEAGLKVRVVGPAKVTASNVSSVADWSKI